ncbi:Fip1 motif-domain-containing protein [Xylaria sp. CBS 124048]|nr:Fip1 motif-domain-containing protein [Xylaria sp. CBS 124048]
MDIDDDDDFYAPEEPTIQPVETAPVAVAVATTTTATTGGASGAEEQQRYEDLEEGEEEDEGAEMEDSDSDIDIITERKDGTKAPPPTQSRYSDIRNIPQRSASTAASSKPPPKKDEPPKTTSGADLPPVSTSTIDVNAIPVYKPVGKPITQVNIDQDLPENEKPWRKPGTDLSDYFNYGFDEFTWALYAAKQDNVRGEYSQDAMAQNNKKMMEEMQMMMMGGMPGMGGAAAAAANSMGTAGMTGMDGMPPEFQAMMQQMMASGMDPSQMDLSAMTAMFSGMQNLGGGAAGQGGQNQSFGGSGTGNQGQNFGYDQGMGRGGGFGGRGRGGRRNW